MNVVITGKIKKTGLKVGEVLKKFIFFPLIFLFVFFTGCTIIDKENEKHSSSMIVNGKSFPYDQKLIEVIDKTQWIDTSEPPTLKMGFPEKEPQFIVKVLNNKNDQYTLWDTGRNFLITIIKGGKSYWLALENEEYVKAKKQTAKYKKVEKPYPISIDLAASVLEQKYTYSSIHPIEGLFHLPEYEQERHCFLEEKECLNFYQGNTMEDALFIKEKLDSKFALIDIAITPAIYTVRNLVIMYIPYTSNNYVLEKDILTAIKSLD